MNKPASFSLPQGRKEASDLILLTTKQLTRNEVIAIVQWEAARLLHANGKLPDFWQRAAAGNRPETSMPMGLADEIFGHRHFPKPWQAVPPEARRGIVSIVAADQTPAARILTGNEVGMQAHRFWKAYSHAMDGLREGQPCPTTLGAQKMDDGGFVALIRFYPGCGRNHIANDLVEELKKLEWPSYGRSNGQDIEWQKTLLKGFAALWLAKAKCCPKVQNEVVYPGQGKKNDYDLLKEAKRRAEEMLKGMTVALARRVRKYSAFKNAGSKADRAFMTSLRAATKEEKAESKAQK